MFIREEWKEKFLTTNRIAEDFASLFIGERIGDGGSRDVYSCVYDPYLVIKIEVSHSYRRYSMCSNMMEYAVWNIVKDTKWKKFFAPCISISLNNHVLIQKRTRPTLFEKIPKIIPDFLDDIKAENWGELDGNIVCHDYGNVKPIKNAIEKTELIKPEIK